MIKVVLFSEDPKLQMLLSSALGEGFEVLFESAKKELNQLLSEETCDAVLFDLDSSSSELESRVDFAREIASALPVVVMADDDLRQAAEELVRAGAFRYCRKPPSIRDLKLILQRAHEKSALLRKLEAAEQRCESPAGFAGMVGSSPGMRQVYDLVRRVSAVNASVLVTGESGCGKELVAQAIHKAGAQASQPMVAVSCGAIPETLIEAELFGHEKGAYTGAAGAREGYFEQAGSGTLFLDEIGELSPATQVKLLRVIQQREFSRLGSTRMIPLRARLIFATHCDLSEMVEQGKFRLDLFYRINVMKIAVPPLRERIEDISALAMHFLRQYTGLYGKQINEIAPGAMSLLEAYSWPGNIRELENVIQRAIIVAHGDSIREEDLPKDLQEEGVINISDFQPVSSFERQIRDCKIRLAVNAVRENHGNKTLAARQLQISRAYLHRLIRLAERVPAPLEAESVLG